MQQRTLVWSFKKTFLSFWNLCKHFARFKRLKKQRIALEKKMQKPIRTIWKKKKKNKKMFLVSIVKQRRWIWKKRKKWNAHRIIKKVFFKKRRWVHLRLKRGYFYALALKKFLRVDLWFKCHANWTYRMFVDSFYRLLVRYLINIRYIANVFRARAMIREKLLQINNKFPKSYSLNDYDLVSFSRTYWFRNRILWSLWRKWLFKKKSQVQILQKAHSE